MKKILIFSLGFFAGTFAGLIFCRNGIASNSGSEFWGSEFADILKESGKGIANNSGSKFFSDYYINERFNKNNNPVL